MKIIYEQGDIVYNNNNNQYAIVLHESIGESVKILEIGSERVFENSPPKAALRYLGTIDLKNTLLDLVESWVEE